MTYRYLKILRYFMGFAIPFFAVLGIGSVLLYLEDDFPIALAIGFLIFFGLLTTYAAFVFIVSFGWVQLDKEKVTIKLIGKPQTLLYSDITKIKTNGFFITLFTQNGRYHIDRNIHSYHLLLRDLKRKIPQIQHDKERMVTDPLPRKINGKISNVFMFLGLALLFFFMVFGMIMGYLESGEWFYLIFTILATLFFGGFGLLFLYEAFWNVPKYIIFEANQITIKAYFGQKVYDPQDIKAVQIITTISSKQQLPSYHLRLTFKSDDKKTLEIRSPWFDQHVFQMMDLIVYHYNVEPIYSKQAKEIKHNQFASGSINPFPFYFERESQVDVHSREQIEAWLRQCKYIRDHVQFEDNDVWIHPVDFEQGRKGDCEDHALWAWRKLIKLNYSAEFVVGYVQNHFGDDGYHAWVTFEENGRNYLLEATAKKNKMIFPLETQTKKYRPLFSVDKNFKTYQF